MDYMSVCVSLFENCAFLLPWSCCLSVFSTEGVTLCGGRSS